MPDKHQVRNIKSKPAKHKMKNGALIKSAMEIILDILIKRISSRMLLGIEAGEDLRLISLAIQVSLIDQYADIQQKRTGYFRPLLYPCILQSAVFSAKY